MMIKMNILDNINSDLADFLFLYSFLFVGLTILWNVYFTKRILYFLNLYRKSVETAKNDILNNYAELALHYKVEIVKYAFLLTINITEISSVLIYLLGIGLTVLTPANVTISNCPSKMANFDLQVITGAPMEAVSSSAGQVGFLLSLALVTCLMEYLDAAYHNINNQSLKSTKIFLSILCVIGVLLIITGSIHQTFILEKLICPIITLIYYIFWIKQTRAFYRTLKWQAVDYQVRGRSSQMVKRAVKNSHYFAVIMCLMGIGGFCLILIGIVDGYFFIVTIFSNCPNLVKQLYGTPDYEPLLTTQAQIDTWAIFSHINTVISTSLSFIVYLSITSQYLLVTLVFFGGMLVKKLNYRFGRVRTRFTPNLTDPLLIS